jgi:hypothetical protein
MELEKRVATIRSVQQRLSVRMLLIDTVRPGNGRLLRAFLVARLALANWRLRTGPLGLTG